MSISEPTVQEFQSRPILTYFLATRPKFLSASALPALVGTASCFYDTGHINLIVAFIAILFAMVAHAGANVFNDYYDFLNGGDSKNTKRLFPFTGGSRFIQNKVLTPKQTMLLASGLFTATILSGLFFSYYSSWQITLLGFSGLLLGWAYSSPPLQLNCKGLGELFLMVTFLMITIGADFVQRKSWSITPILLGLPLSLLITNILYINQYPDREADQSVGKNHLVARYSLTISPWIYGAIFAFAHLWILGLVLFGHFSPMLLLGLVSLPFCLYAFFELRKKAQDVTKLIPAIQTTIVAMTLHGIFMTIGIFLA